MKIAQVLHRVRGIGFSGVKRRAGYYITYPILY